MNHIFNQKYYYNFSYYENFQYDIAKEELDIYVSKEQNERTRLENIRKNHELAKNTVDGRKGYV